MNVRNVPHSSLFVAAISLLGVSGAFLISAATHAAVTDLAPAAKEPATATLTIPTPPAIPTNLSFGDEVTGRHLLYNTRSAYRGAAGVAFTAHWQLAGGGIGDTVPINRTGAESFRAAVAERKLAISVETTTANGEHEIRRAGSDGIEVKTSHFSQSGPKSDARRTWARLTLDESADLQRAMQQVQLNPFARAAEFTMDARAYVAGPDAIIWHSGGETLPGGAHGESICQVEAQNANDRPDERRSRQRICRYLIDDSDHHLLRFEEWEIDRGRPTQSRRRSYRDRDGRTSTVVTPASSATVNYRREDYSGIVLGESAAGASSWSLTGIPANYEEKPLPEVNLPAAPKLLSPDNFDPRAMKLLEKWRQAAQRYVSLSSEIQVAEKSVPRTSDSRPLRWNQQDAVIRYQVAYRRPAKARIVVETHQAEATDTGGPGRGGRGRRGGPGGGNTTPLNGTFVSDGEEVSAIFGTISSSETLDNPARLTDTLTRVGLRERYPVLGLIFNAPPQVDNYDKVTYDGPMLLEGTEPVEVITFHRFTDQRDGRYLTELTTQYYLASDGLPRVVESKTITNSAGLLERDQPPVQTVDIRFLNLALDNNMPDRLFSKNPQ